MGLDEAAALVETKQVALEGERQTPECLKLNPNGKVPALRLDDSVLTESTAIVTYAKDPTTEARR
ncbi:MAG TPA: glutathione S-transferase N-terminal domain-containing protein [Stellaceae bacterium]|nr:glutathione S-transferase N-terminal domain-containing protein [Stellaceae bacterium]